MGEQAVAVAIILSVFALFIAGAVWALKAERRRREALLRWAESNGWSHEEKDRAMHRDYQGFEPFGRGSSRLCSNVMHGTVAGRTARLFDYRFTTQSDKSSTTHHYHILHLRMQRAAPDLVIKKEVLGHKIFDALGGEDIDFESAEFSRRFWVRCKDRRFAYAMITPALMEYLLERPKATWQWRGADLVLHRTGHMKPAELDGFVAEMTGFVERLPREDST